MADPQCKELAHLLVSVGNDGAVRLWDARPEVMLGLGKLGSHDQAATAVACSPCAGACSEPIRLYRIPVLDTTLALLSDVR
eukprot:COSAG02_NODE_33392_length_500_cov_1.753117_2_plen_80_part_01